MRHPSVHPQAREMMLRATVFALTVSGLCLCSPLRADDADVDQTALQQYLTLQYVPEPASILIAVLAAFGSVLVARRRA